MKKWMIGIRGVVLVTVLWVIGWGLGFGGIMEIVDPDGRVQDIWPTVLAIPGLIGGVIFGALLAIAERGRGFDEVSVVRLALWGAVAGVILGVLSIPAEVGDVSPGAAGMIGLGAGVGLIAGLGSGLFFRLLSWWRPSDAAA
jgi:drug/metabolite transporter (DMT)-like permease